VGTPLVDLDQPGEAGIGPGHAAAAAFPQAGYVETTIRDQRFLSVLLGIIDRLEASLVRRDCCPGSGQFGLQDAEVVPAEVWTGLCPGCGRRFELGYAGIVPEHSALHSDE
jgi:hypothetical protein